MTTEERLEMLERELASSKRRSRWLLIMAVVVLTIGGLGMAWAMVRTRHVADTQGKVMSVEQISAKGFFLEDENGKLRGVLTLDEGEPYLALYDNKGTTRALMTVGGKRATGFTVTDEKGMARAVMEMTSDGPRFNLGDENGKYRVVMVCTPKSVGMGLNDENGKTRAMLSLRTEGPALDLVDQNGKARTMITTVGVFGPRLIVSDENGKLVWSAPH